MNSQMNRREFFKFTGFTAVALVLDQCRGDTSSGGTGTQVQTEIGPGDETYLVTDVCCTDGIPGVQVDKVTFKYINTGDETQRYCPTGTYSEGQKTYYMCP